MTKISLLRKMYGLVPMNPPFRCDNAVVAKSMPPHCICGGVPAKFIKFYWTIDQILKHEVKLYTEKERYTRQQLEEIFEKWEKK